MRYISTRGEAPILGFEDVLLAGLARDGGLYVPERWPHFSLPQIAAFKDMPYAEVAFHVLSPFIGDDIAAPRLREIITAAYNMFDEPEIVAPLVPLSTPHYLLELWHGPTFAFKDVAMQLLALLMDEVLQSRAQKMLIVGATSGDTGAAAVQAFANAPHCDLVILFPDGGVSEVQRRQMTCVEADNLHVIAIDGSFDDCQNLVKALFNDHAFRDRYYLGGVNSINWARVCAQITYYFTAAVTLGAPAQRVAFSVPTGNFGDIFAGFAAAKMGLPIERLIIATNENDILARTLASGEYRTDKVIRTSSPSMDIQVSSNFERLLFEASGRQAELVKSYMSGLALAGRFTLDDDLLAEIRRHFSALKIDEAQTAATIARTHQTHNILIDPHSAVGLAAALALAEEEPADVPIITLATAHAAKFPDAIKRACDIEPPAPPALARFLSQSETYTRLANDEAALKQFIESHVAL